MVEGFIYHLNKTILFPLLFCLFVTVAMDTIIGILFTIVDNILDIVFLSYYLNMVEGFIHHLNKTI